MTLDHDLIGFLAGAGIVLSGLSWLYCLRQVARQVNKTLAEDNRLEWGLAEPGPGWRMHWFWAEHERLFPKSRTRIYAALSIVLAFLIAIASTTYFLIAKTP
jgi:hypothetical protein